MDSFQQQQHGGALGRLSSADLESQLRQLEQNYPIAWTEEELDAPLNNAELESWLDGLLPGAVGEPLLCPFSSTAMGMMEEEEDGMPSQNSAGTALHLPSPALSPAHSPCSGLSMPTSFPTQQQQHDPLLPPVAPPTTHWAPPLLGHCTHPAAWAASSPLAMSCDINNGAGLQPYSSSNNQHWAAAASAQQLPHAAAAAPWRGPMLLSPSMSHWQQPTAAPGSMASPPSCNPSPSSQPKTLKRAASYSSSDDGEEGDDTESDDEDDKDYRPCAGTEPKHRQQGKSKQPRLSPAPPQPKGPKQPRIKYQYRGASRHKLTKQWEAHIWDGQAAREPTKKTPRTKGKQVFLGTFDTEVEAARAHDRASLCMNGPGGHTNFPKQDYQGEMDLLTGASAYGEGGVVETLRKSRCSQQGYKKALLHYPCAAVLPHQALPGLWEARFMTSAVSFEYLGAFTTQEAAAAALSTYQLV